MAISLSYDLNRENNDRDRIQEAPVILGKKKIKNENNKFTSE
jgi:hypothetical protein